VKEAADLMDAEAKVKERDSIALSNAAVTLIKSDVVKAKL